MFSAEASETVEGFSYFFSSWRDWCVEGDRLVPCLCVLPCPSFYLPLSLLHDLFKASSLTLHSLLRRFLEHRGGMLFCFDACYELSKIFEDTFVEALPF